MHYTVLAIGILITFYAYCMENKQFSIEFLAIQKIYEITHQCIREFHGKNGLNIFPLNEIKRPQPHSMNCQTKQGLYLVIDVYPTHLGTPYGEIELFNGFSYSHDENIAFTLAFMKHMTLHFIKNSGEDASIVDSYAQKNREIPFYISDTYGSLYQIKKENLESLRNTRVLVTSLPGLPSLYDISSVQNISLPEIVLCEKEQNLKSLETLKEEYAVLKRKYDKQYRYSKNVP